MIKHLTIVAIAASLMAAAPLIAAADVSINRTASEVCIRSDGLPNHATGRFPNRGNPHRIRSQDIDVCVTATPRRGTLAREINRGAIGIGLNGVMFRP